MDNKSFWLANVGDDTLAVSLVNSESGKYRVASIGEEVLYQSTADSFVTAIDKSLSESASRINLPESSEPNSIALIISPFWVGSDGKILSDKIKLFESMFKELKLRPMGFISYDDAIVEEANIEDGFPASFIVVKIEASSFVTSLTYLGKVIERITKRFADSFDPLDLESTLLEFKTDSTLPPQIILIGDIDDETLEKIKIFPWIGKKNVETFLHFPEIKHYSLEKCVGIYTTAITSQFQPPVDFQPIEAAEDVTDDEVVVESEPEIDVLSEVTADELGFTEADNFVVPENIPDIVSSPEEVSPDVTPEITKKPKLKIKLELPHFKIPKINLPFKNILAIPLVISPLLILIPFYFSTAKITLYITPYEFSKTIDVTLDPKASVVDVSKKIVPVSQQSFDINNSATVSTTGQKVIGQKSQGEVTIFNKQDKVQSLSKGTMLVDGSGHKYELLTSAQVASSSSNLSEGVITLGQTKVMAVASDIGPEFNLNKDTVLNFKDYSTATLVAKVSQSLGGGSKSTAKAVSAADKTAVEAQLNTEITSSVSEKISKELANNPGIIKDSIQIKKGRVDTNREVGEESDELTATSVGSVTVFYFTDDQKSALLNSFLSNEAGFKDAVVNQNNFDISLSKGKLTVTGKSTPKVDTGSIIKLVSGKSQSTAISLIKKALPRVYNYQIFTNFSFLKSINPLPFRLSNINIVIK